MDDNLDQFPKMNILVVDDHEYNCNLIEQYFINTHHKLSFAHDGLKAIDQSLKNVPNLIPLDLIMPNLDG